jgi:acetyl-CoA carboxylase biotin carboxyl carrier protein
MALFSKPASPEASKQGNGAGARDMDLPTPLQSLIEFAKSVDLEEVVWEKGGQRVAFKRQVAPPPPAAPAAGPAAKGQEPAPPSRTQFIVSSMVGTFWRSPAKDRPPLVVEGGRVAVGQKVGVVEAMKIPKDVTAQVNGKIVRILVENGKAVEYGQKIFEVEVDA